MSKPDKREYLSLLLSVQETLDKARELGSGADLSGLEEKMLRANALSDELGESTPYPEDLVTQVKGMQERLKYYQQTGLNAPSLSNG